MTCPNRTAEEQAERDRQAEEAREMMREAHDQLTYGLQSTRGGVVQALNTMEGAGAATATEGVQALNALNSTISAVENGIDYVDGIDVDNATDDELIDASTHMGGVIGTIAAGLHATASSLSLAGMTNIYIAPIAWTAAATLENLADVLDLIQAGIDAAVSLIIWALEPPCDPDPDPNPSDREYRNTPEPGDRSGGEDNPDDSPSSFDPLVLDMDGDGVEITELGQPDVFWDSNGDGTAQRTAWISGDDAFLVRDLDGNGKVETQAELFGDETTAAHIDLAQHDENDDGQIDANDSIWSVLRVWQDANQNAETDPGELMSMADAGVASVSVESDKTFDFFEGGRIDREATWTDTSGVEHDAASVFFLRDEYGSLTEAPAGFAYADGALDLLNLKGAGGLNDLRVAASLDSALFAMVEALADDAADMSAHAFRAAVEDITVTWAGLDPADNDGSEAFMRDMLTVFVGDGAEFTFIATLEANYEAMIDSYALRMAVQIGQNAFAEDGTLDHPFSAFTSIAYDHSNGDIWANFTQTVDQLIKQAPGDEGDAAYYAQTAPLLRAFRKEFFGRSAERYEAGLEEALDHLAPDADTAALILEYATAQEVIDGTDGDDAITVTQTAARQEFRRGDSIVEAGKGDDTIDHAESDVFDYLATATTTIYRYSLGDGADTIDVSGDLDGTHELRILDVDAADATLGAAANGEDVVITFADGGSVTLTGVSGDGMALSAVFADGTVWDAATLVAVSSIGQNNFIEGTFGSDTLEGGLGEDTLDGKSGADTYLWADGDGDDLIIEKDVDGDRVDTLVMDGVALADLNVALGSNENAILTADGVDGSVTIENQFGNQNWGGSTAQPKIEEVVLDDATLSWEDLSDLAFRQLATDGDDTIEGTDVAQTLFLSAGNDWLAGDKGADTYMADGTVGETTIRDGGYTTGDRLVVAEAITDYRIEGDDAVITLSGGGVIRIERQFHRSQADTIEEVELADGSVVTVDELQEVVAAGGGVPVATPAPDGSGGTGSNANTGVVAGTKGGDGDDKLTGGSGNDTMSGGAGADTLKGGAGNDTVRGGADDDQLFGNDGADILVGDGGDDDIRAGAGNDFVTGGNGDDTLRGDTGNDKVFGGAGDDDLHGSTGADLLSGGAGNDMLLGGADKDRLFGGNGEDQLFGHSGDDGLLGGAGGDVLWGGAGADTLKGGGGDDIAHGGAGDDIMRGNSGNDRMTGGNGDDELRGGSGHDVMSGGHGDDTMRGDQGDDKLFGGHGEDLLIGAVGADLLLGDAGDDTLSGGAGVDTLRGGLHDDNLQGGSGNDMLCGDAGADWLWGGAGDDVLFGGAGADHFVLTTGGGHDTVRDFVNGVDLIEVDGLADEVSYSVVDQSGGTLVSLSSGDSFFLEGMSASNVSHDDFAFV